MRRFATFARHRVRGPSRTYVVSAGFGGHEPELPLRLQLDAR